MEVLGVDDSPARFALVWEVLPLCGATPDGATGTPAVVIDMTPVRDRSGPARLLGVASGRSKKVLKTWLTARDELWKQAAQVVAMDGFSGFNSAADQELPQARAVMDPYARRVSGGRQG